MKANRTSPGARWLAVAALSIGLAGALAAQSARLTPDVIRDTTLENGLQIIAIRNPTSPVAAVIVAMRGGAATQASEAAEGIPHLIEHLLFKSNDSFEADIGSLSGSFNGTTSDEMVAYFVVLPAKNVTKSIKVMADLVRNPRFSAEDLKTEVPVVRNELERHVSDEHFLLDFTVSQNLWGVDWPKKNIGGNVLALLRATPESLEALYHEFYIPNNAALIVAGDINLAEVIAEAKQSFKSWKKGPEGSAAKLTFPMAPMAATRAVTVRGTSSTVTIQIDWQGPSASTDLTGIMSAKLFTSLLNNRNSNFQHALTDEDLFQSVHVGYTMLNHVGPIVITAVTTPDRLVAATAALQQQLTKLTEPTAFTDEEIVLARKYWRVDSALEWERGSAVGFDLAGHWAVAGLPSYLTWADGIGARSASDVRAFVQHYIAGKPHSVGVLISPASQQSLGAAYSKTLATWSAK